MIEFTAMAGKPAQRDFIERHALGRMRTAVPKKHWRPTSKGQLYAVDNGKFGADTKGRNWSEQEFLEVLGRLKPDHPPAFVVVPDIVAGGDESLRFSQGWRKRLDDLGFGWMTFYLAVQDGMTPALVTRELSSGRWGGVLVGGTKRFKYQTLESWVGICHRRGLKVHVGGIGLPEDLAWARSRGADSCDYTGWARNDRMDYITQGRAQQVLDVRPIGILGDAAGGKA